VAPIPNPAHPFVKAAHHSYPIQRADLEYPTVDVSLLYLACIDKAGAQAWDIRSYATSDSFTDKAVEGVAGGDDIGRWQLIGRVTDWDNKYGMVLKAPAATQDYRIQKSVAGVQTILATESVDLVMYKFYLQKFSCKGTTLSAFRDDMVTPKLSATDTDLTSGQFGGLLNAKTNVLVGLFWTVILRAPSSGIPSLAYFRVPITGSGTEVDPFHAQMPELLTEHPEFGTVNLLALSYSSLIPSKPDGTPYHEKALIRILPQPDRPDYLLPIPECLDKLRETPGCEELSREEAIRLALEMNPKLTVNDLKEW